MCREEVGDRELVIKGLPKFKDRIMIHDRDLLAVRKSRTHRKQTNTHIFALSLVVRRLSCSRVKTPPYSLQEVVFLWLLLSVRVVL
jgi:hypothetical protein